MLTDAGPLVALLDRDDAQHTTCIAVLGKLPAGVLETTWPCFTEATYMLGRVGGSRYQNSLWQLRRDRRLVLLDLTGSEVDHADVLMMQYHDIPMDLADASLMAVAESRGYKRLFTLDADFYIYRHSDGSVLEIVR